YTLQPHAIMPRGAGAIGLARESHGPMARASRQARRRRAAPYLPGTQAEKSPQLQQTFPLFLRRRRARSHAFVMRALVRSLFIFAAGLASPALRAQTSI